MAMSADMCVAAKCPRILSLGLTRPMKTDEIKQSCIMKKVFFLSLLCFVFACSKNENICTINGRYASAPDGTVLYVTPVDDILSPIDSAVVKGGKFAFELDGAGLDVCFISSQKVLDGNFVVVEPGVLNVDFAGDVFVSGTQGNEHLNRFMTEKSRIVNLHRLCEPGVMAMFDMEEAMCDSLRKLAVVAEDIFETYALKEIMENINVPLGCFYLSQSVGVVSSAKLSLLLERVPAGCRNGLYDVAKQRLEQEREGVAMAGRYLDKIPENLAATAVGKKFQNFELDDINGGTLLLSDEVYANRYTLLFFWGSWHESAMEQIVVLSGAYDKYGDRGLQIIGVSLDASVTTCKAFVNELYAEWPQLCNPNGGSAEVAAAYGVTELPVAVLINNKGTIIARMSTVGDVLKKLKELF